jgi:hypothetical protein
VASGTPEFNSSFDVRGNHDMKLKIVLAVTYVSLFASAAWADTSCSSAVGQTYGTLAATGCFETYTNYTITVSDFTAISPIEDGTGVILSQVDMNFAAGLLGFQFTSNAAGLPAFSNLGFTATISCNPGFNCSIFADYAQASFIQIGNTTTGLVTIAASAGANPILLTPTISTYGPTTFPGVSSITESVSYDGANVLGNFETAIYSTSAPIVVTPEPTSILLFGTCILGLGFIKRRAARKI